MRIYLTSVVVNDQQKALRFYTDILGFQVKHNIPMGEYAWITVVSEEAPDGTELLLEPDAHPAVPYIQGRAHGGRDPQRLLRGR